MSISSRDAEGPSLGDGVDGENPWYAFPPHILRGVSQVVLQNNALTGLIILVGIFYHSLDFGIAAVAGSVVATLTAMFLKSDKGMIAAGLFGFNGVLTAVAIVFYCETAFDVIDVSWWRIASYVVIGAAFSTVITAALGAMLAHLNVPPLTAPFVLASWLFVAGTHFSPALLPGHIEPPPAAEAAQNTPAEAVKNIADNYTFATWWQGAGKGFGEIFFQDGVIAGYLILLGILVNSRIGALMALVGALISILVAELLHARETQIHLGMFSYSAILTAIALGGQFYILTWRSFLYTIFGVVITTWLYAALDSVFAPLHLSPYTAPFVLATWLMLMPKDSFAGLIPVPPAEATTPEDNLRRYRESQS